MTSKWLLPSCLWLASLAAGGCEKEPLTQVFVAVDTDLSVPSELDQILIEVRGPDGALHSAEGPLIDESDLPSTLAIVDAGMTSGDIGVTVRGMLRGTEVLRRSAKFAFVDDEVRVLWLDLLRACTGVSCPAEQTCGAAGCRPTAVSPEELTPYDPPIERGRDTDAGMPDGTRDASVVDASTPDGGPLDSGSQDAGIDGGSPDAGADSLCDIPTPCGTGGSACTCNGCECEAVCSGDCEVRCGSSDRCDVDAAFTGGTFDGRCQSSSCTMDARQASSVQVTAMGGATLRLDCRAAGDCEVDCVGRSECLIRCAGASSCGFGRCTPGSAETCGGGVVVCNMPCP